ncbi:hypothetical protein, partial [uncultured Sphingomonas sp.]|uniref:hypothetical protein n=1 Tax=uncultured Sphingomonas sp. TaxID=158754 RepID=UPI00262576D4
MSKFIRTAGEIIAVAVAVAAAIPTGGASAAAGATLLSSALGVSAATASAIAAGVSVSITALEALTAKKPTQVGNPMDWKSDPNAGIPHVAGRMYTAGQIIYRNTWGKDNVYETIQTVYSTGPIKGFENLYVDGVVTSVSGTIVNINDRGKMAASTQLGAQPEARQLGDLGPPNFTAQSRMSGLAASSISFTYDTKGGHTFTTEPQTGYVVLGTPVYDPRQDSTYPGGNGAQRSNDETTWSFTGYDNPGLKALSYLIGYRQKGNVVIGVGLPISAIRVDQLVEMANVCDANGWKMGGVIMSTDDRWTMYGQILQAGGAVPTRSGTRTGCIVNTPKVSLATFERDDIIGDWSIQGSTSRRSRINAIVPSYMAEQSVVGETSDANSNTVLQTTVTWGMAAAGIIIVDDYVTFDGGQRQKAVSYPFVTGHTTTNDNLAPAQVAQLARYDIENSREFGPIAMTMKPRWMGYQAGDVITGGASTTEMGLVGQDIMLLQRSFSPANMTVSMTARSETKAKHAFALGQTTTPPPTPALSGPPLIPVPGADAWALTAGELTSDNGSTSAALFLNGTSDSNSIDAVVVEMRVSTGEQAAADDWEGVTTLAASFSGQLTITSVKDQTAYQVAVSYRKGVGTGTRLILGPASAGQTAVPWTAGVVGTGKPEDNATVGAPAGTSVNGVPVEQVTVSIDSLTTKVQDLVATYGDTESAGAAASAAQAAESAAQAAQTNAGTARDQAQAAFTAADAARQTAAASASSASTYADGAASDMNAAGASASAAHQSEVNAGLAATQAAGSASGAASSASSAAASQTAAGQSASAANTSATNAATSAGQASTFAGNASTSASNASTSATNASGSA